MKDRSAIFIHEYFSGSAPPLLKQMVVAAESATADPGRSPRFRQPYTVPAVAHTSVVAAAAVCAAVCSEVEVAEI